MQFSLLIALTTLQYTMMTCGEKLSVCKTLDIKHEKMGEVTKQCHGQTVFLDQRGKNGAKGDQGQKGGKGSIGPKGNKGEPGNEKNDAVFRKKIEGQISKLQKDVNKNSLEAKSVTKLPRSCTEILKSNKAAKTGIYYVRDINNFKYPVYCNMNVNGGGWTLVAGVHENNIKVTGRCSPGDKWSSESGNQYHMKHGAAAWSNRETFGKVISATSEDYKNAAYFDNQAKNIMIWQVPNNTPLKNYYSASYLRYFTTDGFLSKYGGNLFHLYGTHFPVASGKYKAITGNGPAIPVKFDKGTKEELLSHYGPNIRPKVDSGYIEFRGVNFEGSAYALCPGTKGKKNNGNLEHRCIGSTADNADRRYCGDFSAFAWNQYGTHKGWNVDMKLLHSTFLIFYR